MGMILSFAGEGYREEGVVQLVVGRMGWCVEGGAEKM